MTTLGGWFRTVGQTLAAPLRRSSTVQQHTGDAAESRAAALLQQAGLVVLERNYRVRFGELDIVAEDGAMLVFIEVRARREGATRGRFGGAAASIGPAKQKRLARAASLYLARYRTPPACRFDVVLIGQQAQDIEWMKNAFSLESF